jgi:hypothetical protein
MLFFICGVWLAPEVSYADGTFVKIVKKKYAAVKGGKNEGFEKRSRVCFYDDNDEKVTCGIVVLAKEKHSYVLVRKSATSKLKRGMTVRSLGKKPEKVADQQEEEQDQEDDSGESLKGADNFKIAYIMTPITPAQYYAISYYAPYDANRQPQTFDTLWDRAKQVNTSQVGFGAELGLDLGSSKLNVGGRLRLYDPMTVLSDYDDDEANYAETSTSAQAMGAWVDYYYLILDYGSFSIDIGNGLDVDISQLDMKMEQKNDNNATANSLYDVSSSLTVISLRTNLVFNYYLGPVGLQFGTFLLLPVADSGSFSANTVNDPQIETGLDSNITPEDDIKDAIAHKPVSFGVELFMAAYYAF